MKCPACSYKCSETNDLCPECFTDLREQKSRMGFRVQNPGRSYDSLLAELSGESSTTAAEVWGVLSGLFKREAPLKQDVTHEAIGATEVAVAGGGSISVAANSEVHNEPTTENVVTASLNDLITKATEHESTTKTIVAEILDTSLETESSQECSNIETPAAESGVGQENRSATIAEIKHEPVPVIAEHKFNPDEIQQLFKAAEEDLVDSNLDSAVSIELLSAQDEETIGLLFEVADEYLLDPESESTYTNVQSAAETKELESVMLVKQLQATQSAISSNFINLKGNLSSSKQSNVEEAKIGEPLLKNNEATDKQIYIAVAMDCAIVTIISVLSLLGYVIFNESYHWQVLTSAQPVLVADWLALIGWAIMTFILTTIVYLIFTTGLSGSTFGMDFTQIRTIHRARREHTSLELLARCFILSANLFGFVFLYSFITGKACCDWITSSIHVEAHD